MSKRKALPFTITAVIMIVLLLVLKSCTSSKNHTNSAPSTAKTTSLQNKNCTTLNISSSSEKAALLSEIAGVYNQQNKQIDGTCAQVSVVSAASGETLKALTKNTWDESAGQRPDVWTPAASSWLNLLSAARTKNDSGGDITSTKEPSIASTPLVIAMPKPMAEVLGWPQKALGWNDILKLAQNDKGWGAYNHPEWGAFKLGKTNPTLSTSGLNATIGTYFAATGLSSDLSIKDINNPKTIKFVEGIEQSVVHYGDTTLTFLTNLQNAADKGKSLTYVSAVAVEEKSVWDYNQGNPSGDPKTLGKHAKPTTPLVAIYPKEGTLYSDSPFAVLNTTWVTSAKKDIAADFLKFVQSAPQQKRFTDAAFRNYQGKTGSAATLANGIISTQPINTLTPPNPQVLSQIENSWNEQRKKAKVLIVMDVSGSMGDSVLNTNGSKLDLAKKAALAALNSFSPTDEVGLWAFSSDLNSQTDAPYLQLVPNDQIKNNITRLKTSIANLQADGGTALYATTRDAANQMQQTYEKDRINAIVLLTDGKNEYPKDTNLDSLVQSLSDSSENNPVRIFTIGYGADADLPTLQKISAASGAAAYDATNPTSINKVFTSVISNF